MSMLLFNSINSNNNQDNKVKVENYIKKLEELEAVVEKQVSDIKYFAPTIPIIGVSSTVGVNFQGEEEEEDDDEEEEDDDATRVLDMTMDDGDGAGIILDDTGDDGQ